MIDQVETNAVENESRSSSSARALSNEAFESSIDLSVAQIDGKRSSDLRKLPAGDHNIELKDGRQFLLHIPENAENKQLPVLFVLAGSAQPKWEIKDFAIESGMNGYADDPEHSFIAVYPLPKKHLLGRYSKEAAWGWNAEGSLLDKKDVKHAGYDDMAFIKSIAELLPRIANVDKSHRDWGAIAWSQGGPFLNALISKEDRLFPSVGLVGSTMQNDYPYKIGEANAKNVAIINLLADRITLPIHGDFSYHRKLVGKTFLEFFGRTDLVQKAHPLAAMNNFDHDPRRQESFYARRLFPLGSRFSVHQRDLATPAKSHEKDFVKEYRPLSTDGASDYRALTVFNLINAKHSYPGPIRENARTNDQEKYLEFDASAEFVKLFNAYNSRIKQARKH